MSLGIISPPIALVGQDKWLVKYSLTVVRAACRWRHNEWQWNWFKWHTKRAPLYWLIMLYAANANTSTVTGCQPIKGRLVCFMFIGLWPVYAIALSMWFRICTNPQIFSNFLQTKALIEYCNHSACTIYFSIMKRGKWRSRFNVAANEGNTSNFLRYFNL